MRGVRWLLLLAMTAILVGVGSSYYLKKARQAREAPPPPAELPSNISATSDTWIHTIYDGEHPVAEIRARTMRQIREPSEFELEGVELRIFQTEQEGGYDRVRSALAIFDIEQGTLYSEGEVEITLDVPDDESLPEVNLMVIRSSQVHFETKTGKAITDQPTSFRFPRGEGQSVGATYEPSWSEIRMHSQVKLRWHGVDGGVPMVVESGELVYKWDLDKVDLNKWARFERGPLSLEAGDSHVFLREGVIERVEAQAAHGSNIQGARRVDYEADLLRMHFRPNQAMERIEGENNARLVSRDPAAETEVTADRLFLEFTPVAAESHLDNLLAMGQGRVESRPLARADGRVPATRVLTSEQIKAVLRPGGELLDVIETHAPATVEFLPNGPGQRHRRLDGERIWIHYGENNNLQTFRAVKATTRSDAISVENGEPAVPTLTWSDDLLATFDPVTGEMSRLEQWNKFRYQEEPRKAKADKGVFEVERNLILLTGGARIWDEAGSTTANSITVDQERQRVTASGQVSSTRVTDSGSPATGMLASGEPVHATADDMSAASDGSFISYDGNAVLWQGANRLHGDRVEIDRKAGSLMATGNVLSRFRNQRSGPETADGARVEVETVVRSQEMVYLEESRSARYNGDVRLNQPGLDITSRELTAFFKDGNDGGSTSLDRALADGDVRITQTGEERVRTGLAEHAEYHLDEEKVILLGGRPQMIDSLRGATQGNQLTYYSRNDRLLVDGADTRPAVSKIRKN